MTWAWFRDYVHQVSVAVALFLILTTGIIIEGLLVFRQPFPDGYGDWLLLLGALAGVNVVGLGAIRATSTSYVAAKAAGKASAAPTVNVEGDAVNLTAERPASNVTTERAIPQAGARSRDPGIRAGLETLAARQRATTDDDEGII